MEKNISLDDCPFCGHEAKIKSTYVLTKVSAYKAYCTNRNCQVETKLMPKQFGAAHIWNRRVK